MNIENDSKKSFFLSVVIPVYNESQVIGNFFDRAYNELTKINCEFEMLFVDDGSFDGTTEWLLEQQQKQACIKVIRLSRNFGHQVALTAGLDHSQGDVVISMDADLQDPPEVISKMIEKWREGYDIVYGRRVRRFGEKVTKTFMTKIAYKLIRKISHCDIPVDVGDFRLINRKSLDVLGKMRERYRYVRGLVAWVGFKHAFVDYERPPRAAGETKYPFFKLLRLSFDGLSSFSIMPLRVATSLGVLSAAIGLLYIPYVIYTKLFLKDIIEGWATTISAVFFLGGVQLLCLGVIGEYLGMVHQEVKQRPLYVIDFVSD